jgi:acyl-CoA synthetase (AMP-forming)/AMP-acid ligase II
MYGQTEATARMSILDPMYTSEKIGSIGKAIPGGEFKIEYIDEKSDKTSLKAGELVYSGPNVMMGYAENRFDLAKGDESNGILHTGDVATIDDEGFYFIVGRLKRFVKIAGKRINLDELENDLNRSFTGVACLGEDDSLKVFTSNVDPSVMKIYICSKFNLNPLNVRVHLVEDIPRLSNGKVDYKELENQIYD